LGFCNNNNELSVVIKARRF